MAIQSINLVLSAQFRDTRVVTSELFLEPLNQVSSLSQTDYQCIADRQPGRSGLIVFYERKISEIEDAEPYEILEHELALKLKEIADWLHAIPASVFEELKTNGLYLFFIIETWIDADQFDLELPPVFLKELGIHEIPLTIISNE
ncbi:hypothetical protein Enr10x_30090 [Gimesia panareensis]|uniref:DUF4279 domain-containing protein n=2 Tax=Gimesia panareensis TaxID=2527978 RepID=A0A517Q7X4_9PLAN|nr:hypothetical protein Enr10x_30090 [Gimesia panareensis]